MLSTIDYLVKEISDRLGTRTELEGTEQGTAAPAGRIERALNDALEEVLATYKQETWISEYNWYIKSNIYKTGAATNAAEGVTISGVHGGVPAGDPNWTMNTTAPGPCVATAGVAGAIAAGSYSYMVTYSNVATDPASGHSADETEPSLLSNVITLAVPSKIMLTNIGKFSAGIYKAARIYRSETDHPLDGPWYYVGKVTTTDSSINTLFTDNALALTIRTDNIQPLYYNGLDTIGQGWIFKYDDEDIWHEIISAPYDAIAGTWSLVVSPRVANAHTAATYQIIQNKFRMPVGFGGSPTDIHHIIDVRDVEQQRRLDPCDIRYLDKMFLATGNPTHYARLKNYLITWPACDLENVYFRIRYYARPGYKRVGQNPSLTFSPLNEEWQSVIVDLATARCLMHQMETERAAAYRQMAKEKAEALMKPVNEEDWDHRTSLKPDSTYKSERRDGR
jgi:hypothetical protein